MIIPEIYKEASVDNLTEDQRSFLKEVVTRKSTGLYIYGGVGTGKTYMIFAMVNRLKQMIGESPYRLAETVQVWNTTELISRIRETFDRPSDVFVPELLEYKGILVLDDVGSEKPSEWVTEQLYRIINRRYEEALPTVYTSNLTIEELDDRIGERSVSRIVGSCRIVELTGNDKRLIMEA